jgi:hypothetical protein
MESKSYKEFIATEIRLEVIRQRRRGKKTSKGDLMSFAAIARTLDPPVTRTMVYLVIDGQSQSRRVRKAIERELGKPYWVRENAG